MSVEGLVVRGMRLRSVDKEKRTCDFIASTDAIDSYDEVVEQTWRLDRYKANPVALFAHQSRELPIGKATRCEVVDGQLECTIAFGSKESNPLAENVWQCVLEETLRAVSVGFLPHSVRYEKRDGKEIYVLSDNELYEISVTPIPANPEALAKMRQLAASTTTRQKAGALAAPQEKPRMDPELEKARNELAQRNATIETKDRELTEVKARAAGLETANKALETQNAKLAEERDAAAKAEKAASDKLVDQEVDGLVGKKITPAEKGDFVELAKTNRPLFERMIAQRSPMTMLDKVVPADPAAPTNTAADPTVNAKGSSGGQELAAIIESSSAN